MAVIGSSTLNVVPKFPNLKKEVESALGSLDTSAAGSKMGEGVGKGMSGGLVKSGAVIGAFSAITQKAMAVVSDSVGDAVRRFDTLNNYPVVMQQLGYSAESAQSSISKMSDRLSTLPTRLDAMASTVQGIAAITGDLDQATDAGLALNDMLVASGSSTELVNAAMEQFRQMLSKGKPEMEDWKSLTSAMPGQMNQLAQAMLGPTSNANDLYAALGGGKNDPTHTMDDLLDAMIRLDTAGGAGITSFKEQAETAAGGVQTSMSNMQNAVVKGVAGIMDEFGKDRIAGAFDDAKGAINSVFSAIQGGVGAAVPALEQVYGAAKSIAPEAVAAAAGFAALKTAGGAVSDAAGRLKELEEQSKRSHKSAGMLQRANALLGTSFTPLSLGAAAASIAVVGLASVLADGAEREANFEEATRGLSEAASDASALEGYRDAVEGVGESAGFSAMSLSELAESNARHAESIRKTVDEAEGELAQLNAAQGVIGQYAGQTDLSAEAQGRLEWAISKVNEQFGLTVTAADVAANSYEDAQGNVVDLKQSIDQLIESKKQEIKTAALTDSLTEAYQAQADAAKTLAQVQAESYGKAEQEAQRLMQAGMSYGDAMAAAQAGVNNELDDARQAYESATESVSQLEGQLGDMSASASDAASSLDKWGSSVSPLFEALLQQSTGSQNALAMLKDDLDGLGVDAEEMSRVSEGSLEDLARAYDGTAASIVGKLENLGISMDETAASAAKASADVVEALREMDGDAADALAGAGVDVDDFARKLSEAGVSTDQLRQVGTDNLTQLAQSCGQNVDAMVYFIQHYNDTPILDKDGNVQVDQASLVDAQGNVWTWNGTSLVDKDGRAAVDDLSLLDAQGNVWTWNGTELVSKDGHAHVDSNAAAAARDNADFNNNPVQDQSATVTITQVFKQIGQAVTSFFTGGRASGGVRLHADGFIAAGPTMVGPHDLIGEAGAEAYTNVAGNDYIVPLTNRKYSQPFIDLLAEGIRQKGAAASSVRQTFNVYANDPSLVAAMVARRQKRAWQEVLA